MDLAHEEGKSAFLDTLQRYLETVETLDDRQLLAPTRCYGWSVVDLLVHINLSLQEMSQDFSAATDREPEVDAATYWLTELPRSDPGADEVDAISFIRRVASAYRRPTGLVGHLRGTADALTRAAAQVGPSALVFQSHVMTTGNYFATWAAELAVHHLDLMVALPLAGPTTGSLQIARRTVESLLGDALPAAWSDEEAVLIGWGRTPPTPDQRTAAGALADRLPVLS